MGKNKEREEYKPTRYLKDGMVSYHSQTLHVRAPSAPQSRHFLLFVIRILIPLILTLLQDT